MDSIDQYTRGPAEDLLEFAGEDVTLVTRVVDHYDDYNDPVYTEERTAANAEVIVRGTPAFERRIEGVESEVQAVAWVMDYHDVDSAGGSPTTVETSTHEFTVHNNFNEENGKLRLHLAD